MGAVMGGVTCPHCGAPLSPLDFVHGGWIRCRICRHTSCFSGPDRPFVWDDPQGTEAVVGAVMRDEEGAIYAGAVSRFGELRQMLKCCEECGELASGTLQYIEGRRTAQEVASEIADVEIMCAQMRLMFGDGLVDEEKRAKLERLARLIRDEETRA